MYIFCELLRNDYTNQGKLGWLYKMFSAYYKADSFVYKVHTKKKKNLEEIQDQIAICAKREIKVQKRNKSLKKK